MSDLHLQFGEPPVPNVRLEVATALLSGDYEQCVGNLRRWAGDNVDDNTNEPYVDHCVQGVILDVLRQHDWGQWSSEEGDVFFTPSGQRIYGRASDWIIHDALGLDQHYADTWQLECDCEKCIEAGEDTTSFATWLVNENDEGEKSFADFADVIKELP